MLVWICRVGEAEGRRSRGDDREAVGHKRVIGIPWRLEGVLEAGYRVSAGVRYGRTGGAKSDPADRGGEHHVSTGLHVVTIDHGAPQILSAVLKGPGRPDIGDRVGSLE